MDAITCAITGPLGNVGYNILFFLAQGHVFGPDTKLNLRLLEIPELATQLEGLKMELEDCAFPMVREIRTGSDPFELFGDVDCAILAGARPRGPGMERKELLEANGAIFQKQGQALEQTAKKSCRVLVVGNPCNTNCLIAMHNAPSIPRHQFCAMTRLDENRARSLLARKAGVDISQISPVVIWGNHSSTLVADPTTATISGRPVRECLDVEWLKTTFLQNVRGRGAAIITARGKSSAASAAWGAIETIQLFFGQPQERMLFSNAIYSLANPYGIDEDLIFSFPCRMKKGKIEIDGSMRPNDSLWKEVKASEQELIQERDAIRHLLG